MRHRIQTKFILITSILIIFAASISCISFLYYNELQQELYIKDITELKKNEVDKRVRNILDEMSIIAKTYTKTPNNLAIKKLLPIIAAKNRAVNYALIVDKNRRVIADTRKARFDEYILDKANLDGKLTKKFIVKPRGKHLKDAASPIFLNRKFWGIARVVYNYETAYELVAPLLKLEKAKNKKAILFTLILSFSLIIIGILLAILVNRSLRKQINRLATDIKELSQTNKLVGTNNELNYLADAANKVIVDLKVKQDLLENYAKDLNCESKKIEGKE